MNPLDLVGTSNLILDNILTALHEHKPMVSSVLLVRLKRKRKRKVVDAAVTIKTQRLVNPPTEHMSEPSIPSDGEPNFLQLNIVLNSTMQNAINKPPLDKPSTEAVPMIKSDEDEDNDDTY